MIARSVFIKAADWTVHVFIDTGLNDAPSILRFMRSLGCSRWQMRIAKANLHDRWKVNTGITSTVTYRRSSVTVISECTSIREFLNSYAHELNHLEMHIGKACGYDPYGEDASRLSGELMSRIFLELFADKI